PARWLGAAAIAPNGGRVVVREVQKRLTHGPRGQHHLGHRAQLHRLKRGQDQHVGGGHTRPHSMSGSVPVVHWRRWRRRSTLHTVEGSRWWRGFTDASHRSTSVSPVRPASRKSGSTTVYETPSRLTSRTRAGSLHEASPWQAFQISQASSATARCPELGTGVPRQ